MNCGQVGLVAKDNGFQAILNSFGRTSIQRQSESRFGHSFIQQGRKAVLQTVQIALLAAASFHVVFPSTLAAHCRCPLCCLRLHHCRKYIHESLHILSSLCASAVITLLLYTTRNVTMTSLPWNLHSLEFAQLSKHSR